MSASTVALDNFEQIVGVMGEQAAVMLATLVVGFAAYWMVLVAGHGLRFACPKAIGYVDGRIDTKARDDYRDHGLSFQGFTIAAWKIGFICAAVVYAVLWVGKHFPSLWLVWGALFLASVLSLSIMGYMKSGERMTLQRFAKFYGPTITVVVMQLPDILKEAVKLVVATI